VFALHVLSGYVTSEFAEPFDRFVILALRGVVDVIGLVLLKIDAEISATLVVAAQYWKDADTKIFSFVAPV
jgi:hypothetical protein